jgi:two-component system sensor histidine kinase GlrK
VNFYPRSFLGLIVLGAMLAMLPLLAAIVYASFTVDDLTRRSDEAVKQASAVATLGYAVDEELGQMERILRQYEQLRDPMLLDDYATVRLDWHRSIESYSAIPLLAQMAGRVSAMHDAEVAAYRELRSGAPGLARLKETLGSIRQDLQVVVERASRIMAAEREAFRLRGEAVWQRLIVAMLLALALTGLMLWTGRRMLARLLMRFELAVLALGQGRLTRRIKLRGPADLQRVGMRLEWLRRRLLALENERTRVLRHVSHELRTPLAAIREGASLFADGVAGPLTPNQEKVAGIMRRNVLRLQRLIDSMLSMQQANHAREKMETSEVRLDTLVKQTLATHGLAMRGRNLRVASTLEPLTVEGGGEALATLAGNLISNAVKFSPEGGLLEISLVRQGRKAVLDVIDEGPGISAEDRERIFEPFFRGNSSNGVAGVGLGLAIAHEFALAHQGTLEVIAREGGAHLRLQLPLAVTAAEPEAAI